MIKLETIKKVVAVHKIEITGRKIRFYTDSEGTQKNLVEFLSYTREKAVHVIDVAKAVKSISRYYDMIKSREIELLQGLGAKTGAEVTHEMIDGVYPSITKFIYYLEQELNCVLINTKVPKSFSDTPPVTKIDLEQIYIEDGGGTLYIGKLSKKSSKTSFEINFGIEAKGVFLKGVTEDDNVSHIKVLHITIPKNLRGVSVFDVQYLEKYLADFGLDVKREGL